MCAPRASASTSSGCAYSRSIRSRTRRSRARSRRCCSAAGAAGHPRDRATSRAQLPRTPAAYAWAAAEACSRTSCALRCGCSQKNMCPAPSQQLELRSRDQTRDQLAVGGLHEPVFGAVDDERRHPHLAETRARVMAHDRRELGHEDRDRGGVLRGDLGVELVGALGGAVLGGDHHRVAGLHRLLVVAGQDRLGEQPDDAHVGHLRLGPAGERAAERQRAHALGRGEDELLGDHPAHRDADDVRGLDLERVEQADRVLARDRRSCARRRPSGPLRPAPRLSNRISSKLVSSPRRKPSPQCRLFPPRPWTSSSGSPAPRRS